jgi:hypothetical protein
MDVNIDELELLVEVENMEPEYNERVLLYEVGRK